MSYLLEFKRKLDVAEIKARINREFQNQYKANITIERLEQNRQLEAAHFEGKAEQIRQLYLTIALTIESLAKPIENNALHVFFIQKLSEQMTKYVLRDDIELPFEMTESEIAHAKQYHLQTIAADTTFILKECLRLMKQAQTKNHLFEQKEDKYSFKMEIMRIEFLFDSQFQWITNETVLEAAQ